MNNQTAYQPTAFDKFSFVVRKIFSGGLFLAISIIVSFIAVFQLITFFVNLANLFVGMGYDYGYSGDYYWAYIVSSVIPAFVAFLSSLLNLTFYILLTVGCWCMYAGAVSRRDLSNRYITKFGLVRAFPIFKLVMSWIATALLAVVGSLSVALMVVDYYVFYDFSMGFIFGLTGNMELVRSMADGGAEVLFFTVLIVMIIAVVFNLIRYAVLCRMTKAVKRSMYTGKVPPFKPMFFAVLSFIFAGFGLVGAFIVMANNPISGLTMLLEVSLLVMTGVMMIVARGKLVSYGVIAAREMDYGWAPMQYAGLESYAPAQPQHTEPQSENAVPEPAVPEPAEVQEQKVTDEPSAE